MFGDKNEVTVSDEAKEVCVRNVLDIIKNKDFFKGKDRIALNTMIKSYLDFVLENSGVELDRSMVNISNLIISSFPKYVEGPDSNRNYHLNVGKIVNDFKIK